MAVLKEDFGKHRSSGSQDFLTFLLFSVIPGIRLDIIITYSDYIITINREEPFSSILYT